MQPLFLKKKKKRQETIADKNGIKRLNRTRI